MKRLNKLFLASIALLVVSCSSNDTERNFAIVVDTATLYEAQGEIEAYASAIKMYNGMNVSLIEDVWGVPDSIRVAIKELHAQKGLEGVVLMGDIPVAMIRDAQHLTSAFKMDQEGYERIQSSVPSDRYYDDFDLEFTYLDREEEKPYFYYSLNYDSPQHLDLDIYSGRIRPMTADGQVDYAALRAYLKKVVAEKASGNKMDHTFFFSGHGYISESVVARLDEQEGIYDHFPWLKGQKDRLFYMDHKQYHPVKEYYMNEMMREEIDYAISHHHGYWDTQYFNGMPEVKNVTQAQEYISKYCRSKLQSASRRGRSTEELMQSYQKAGIPRSWYSDFNATKVLEKDSIFDASLDLVLEDFDTYDYKPNARLVVIDACYCGSFHREVSIASRYIFNEGKTIAVVANSVNVLQDKWGDKMVGLIGLGMPVGQLVRYNPYLESHTIGDPTHTFATADPDYNVGKMLASKTSWRKELKSKYPDIQSLAMVELYRAGEISQRELLEIFKSSEAGIVRVLAMELLAKKGGDEFIEAVKLGVHDSYELAQRFALKWITRSGDPAFVDSIIELAITNNTSERINFNIQYALSVYPKEPLLESFDRLFNDDRVKYIHKEEVGKTIRNVVESCSDKWVDDIEEILSEGYGETTKSYQIRLLRNSGVHYRFADLLDNIAAISDKQQWMLVEAVGWHQYSYLKESTIERLKAISENEALSEKVRQEAIKSINRLSI